MSNQPLLRLTVQKYTKDQLAIDVTNISGADLTEPFQLDLTLPEELLIEEIRDAAAEAPTKMPPRTIVDKYVKGMEGKLTAWALPDSSDNFVTLSFVNDLDEKAVEIKPPMVLPAGPVFTIVIPLDKDAEHISFNLLFGYEYKGIREDGELELKGDDPPPATAVTFTTDQRSPTAIEPMTDVKIMWEIKKGVRAVLRGPLPGGNTECELSDSTTTSFKMTKGWFVIKAVSSMTFMLQAEVEGPLPDSPHVLVGRMLSLDIATTNKYGLIAARPSRVLPYGFVDLDWAAWGVLAVQIQAGTFHDIELTDMTLSGFAQGRGVLREQPSDAGISVTASLYTKANRQEGFKKASETSYVVNSWRKMKSKGEFTGHPLGLAVVVPKLLVAGPKMALLTTDGLWTANVGASDDGSVGINDLDFTLSTSDKAEAWLAVAAIGDQFVVLRLKDRNHPQVVFYKLSGERDDIDPLDLELLLGSDPVFDLVVYRERAYVVVESSVPTGRVRSAFSVKVVSSNEGTNTIRKAIPTNEPLLQCLPGYRLLTFDNALFALNRDTGHMLRLQVKDDKLEPYKAASAIDQKSVSMVKKGLLVPFGRALVLLSPSAVPSHPSLSNFGLKNVLPSKNLLTAPQLAGGAVPQDLVYSAEHNRWSRCGHGVDINDGVVAFRGGQSPRLWAIAPDKYAYTLTGSTEDLFIPDFVPDRVSPTLPAVLDKTREIKIVTHVETRCVPLNETCRKAFLTAFSATRPVDVSPVKLTWKKTETFEVRYNEADPGTITMRFLLQRPAGIKNEYFLEMTISGTDLSTATTVFKRIAEDGSIAEVPDTRQQHSTDTGIVINPQPIAVGIRLKLTNSTHFDPLIVRRPSSEREFWEGETIPITTSSAALSVSAPGAGEVSFHVDFTLPHGFQAITPNEPQKTRLAYDSSKSQGLRLVQPKFDSNGNYEIVVSYGIEKSLRSVYMGDGVPGKDGEHFYLLLSDSPGQFKVMKFRANDLDTAAQSITLNGGGVFSLPNNVAVLKDEVLAIERDFVKRFTHDLRLNSEQKRYEDTVINLQGSPNDDKIFKMPMHHERGHYSYFYTTTSFDPNFEPQEWDLTFLKGFRRGRNEIAPDWVTPNSISPMSVSGDQVVICIEGGLFWIQVPSETVMEIPIDSSERAEAIVIDPKHPVVFCAHSQQNGQKLLISRVESPTMKRSITIPSGVTEMATNTNPPAGLNFRYNCPRAVSLAVSDNTLFVSHGKTIRAFNKMSLIQKQECAVGLPCRLIQVRPAQPGGGTRPSYSTPKERYIAWAIGASYVGDGQTRNNYQTVLYKLSFAF
jgi:hypothetical protein